MKTKPNIVLFFLVSFIAVSCNKNNSIVSLSRTVDPFQAICMKDNINVRLKHSDSQNPTGTIELKYPEKLMEKIVTETKENTLFISNNQLFNWTDTYDDCSLTVYFDSLREIQYESLGFLISDDTIYGMKKTKSDTIIVYNDSISSFDTIIKPSQSRSFRLFVNSGCGDIDLTLKVQVYKGEYGLGTSKITLKGERTYGDTLSYSEHVSRFFGRIDASELESEIVVVSSESPNDILVWVNNRLEANLRYLGDVYYKKGQKPIIFDTICTHGGHVKPL